jgi:putative acetyltransferase
LRAADPAATVAVVPAPVEIRAEQESDRDAIRRVQTAAFGDGGRVAGLVSALRAAPAPLPPLSFTASVAGQVAGHVMLSASRLDAPPRLVDVYVLSPLGVLPGFQRRGVGTRLAGHALAAARKARVPLVFLEGDPAGPRPRRPPPGPYALTSAAPGLRYGAGR